MYDRILVPTDGGDHSLSAARRALDLAADVDATVHALYVVATDTGPLTVSKTEVRDALRAVEADAGEAALAAIETLAEGVDVDLVTEFREGVPDEEIVAYVADAGIDLVVMGTHGRRGVRRRLVGSVAERVVRASTAPVMTVPATRDTEA